MRKDDVEFHRLGYGYDSVPAVNVKVRFPFRQDDLVALVALHNGETDPRWSVDWIDEHASELEWTFEAACEDAWGMLADEARNIYGPSVHVYSEGRSGGWAYVDRLPDFETWDAIELGRWARFAKIARLLADDVPYQMVTLAYLNTFEAWRDEDDKRMTGPTFEPVR